MLASPLLVCSDEVGSSPCCAPISISPCCSLPCKARSDDANPRSCRGSDNPTARTCGSVSELFMLVFEHSEGKLPEG